MTKRTYASPPGGLPPQSQRPDDTAVFTTAYTFIPASVMRDIVTSYFPHWEKTRAWIIARPLSGFAETFAQYIVEVAPGGGSANPEPDTEAEGVLFITHGAPTLTLAGTKHELRPGSYAFIPPGSSWQLINSSDTPAIFHWVRKAYQIAEGIDTPEAFVTHEDDATTISMPDTNGAWATTRFVDPSDLRHDMHVNIVTLQPGGVIPFAETHVMEHGLYVLEGEAEYRLNTDWVKVGPGDFMWLRAFCPQACVAKGTGPFRYLLYKDVNRHAKLKL